MRPSDEIRDLELRRIRLLTENDAAGIMDDWSEEAGAVFIGSGTHEWLTNRAEIERVVRESAASSSARGATPEHLEVLAWEEGTVGWASVRYALSGSQNRAAWFLITRVYHREGGAWKGVASHFSIYAPDE